MERVHGRLAEDRPVPLQRRRLRPHHLRLRRTRRERIRRGRKGSRGGRAEGFHRAVQAVGGRKRGQRLRLRRNTGQPVRPLNTRPGRHRIPLGERQRHQRP